MDTVEVTDDDFAYLNNAVQAVKEAGEAISEAKERTEAAKAEAESKAKAAEEAGKAYAAALADQVIALDDFNSLMPKYTIISGNGSTWQQKTSDPLVLISDGEMKWFTGLMIDGQLVDPSNYTVREGSTEVYLNPGYLDTLGAGQHTVRFLYKYGMTADGTFQTVEEEKAVVPQDVKNNAAGTTTKATIGNRGGVQNGGNGNGASTSTASGAQTGDTSNAAASAAAMAGSGLMAAFLAIFDRKRRRA